METKERKNDKTKTVENWPKMSCWQTGASPEEMPNCCNSISEAHNCSSMMDKCMKMCRWFPLIPVILGIALLLLGYYLDASITRVLWMFVAGLIVLLGTLGLILTGRMKKICRWMK